LSSVKRRGMEEGGRVSVTHGVIQIRL
jgi:hypothetical protein